MSLLFHIGFSGIREAPIVADNLKAFVAATSVAGPLKMLFLRLGNEDYTMAAHGGSSRQFR
jgi:hypothetical protein